MDWEAEEQKRERRSQLLDVADRRARQSAEQYRSMGRDLTPLGEAYMRKVIFDDLLKKAGLE